MEKIKITAGILAGGKSSRMGENKAFLPWKGSTFLEKIIALFDGFEEVLVSVAEKNGFQEEFISIAETTCYEKMAASLVEDVRKDYGPLEGVYRLLLSASCPWIFLTATDMPLLNRDLIIKIAAIPRENCLAVVLRENGRMHPMCGLYHKEIIPVLEKLFADERHSMQALLERIPVKIIDLEELGLEASILTNVNTPEEYDKIRKEKEVAK